MEDVLRSAYADIMRVKQKMEILECEMAKGATEEQLLRNLRAMTNRTVLIITHREAALNFCDKQIHFARNP